MVLKGSCGTLSEITLALKALNPFIGLDAWYATFPGRVIPTQTEPKVMTRIEGLLITHRITAL